MENSKLVIVDTIGQLPIMGGVTGPILHPFRLDVADIRTLIAFRIDVKEVITDANQKPLVRKNRYVTVPLNVENYDKVNEAPINKKKQFRDQKNNGAVSTSQDSRPTKNEGLVDTKVTNPKETPKDVKKDEKK